MDTTSVSESAAELSSGQSFAGWRIERELARGGMGVLYLAHHPRLPRTDVIKVLSPSLSANQRFRERFLREANRMSSLSHPHVMPIHDSGEAPDGTLYLVMPYIAGGDLRGLLQETGRLAPDRAARLIAQLAAALDAAHRVGVVHRDVKPENVMLASVEPDESDHALLTDFGISRAEMSSTTLTATGELLLTPAYAAPEQVLGGSIDARADQYALACILYELLTGRPPYLNEAPVAMLMAHVQEPPPQLAKLLGLPLAIDDVLGRAMAKKPELRYPSCREMAKAALAVLAPGTPMAATAGLRETLPAFPPRPGSPPPQPYDGGSSGPPRRRRRRGLVIVAAAIVVLAAAGAVVGLTTGGGTKKPIAPYDALLTRIPQDVRGSCKNNISSLTPNSRPFVVAKIACNRTIDGRQLSVTYRAVAGDTAAVTTYRTMLGLGGSNHSPGNCMTFVSTDPNSHGTKGFGQIVQTSSLAGGVWCDMDGTLWYLQSTPARGHPVTITEVHTSAGNAQEQAPRRFSDLEAVAPKT